MLILVCDMMFLVMTFLFFFVQGSDHRAQVQMGNGTLIGANYVQVNHVPFFFPSPPDNIATGTKQFDSVHMYCNRGIHLS